MDRERTKAANRQALADAGLRLFLERGYDNVTVREVAEAAGVSPTTLLKHFPSKEALVFDRDAEVEAALVAAVTDRPGTVSVVDALRAYIKDTRVATAPGRDAFSGLVHSTPALLDHWHRMWMRHEDALTKAIAAAIGAPAGDPRSAALAHFALETSALAARSDDPAGAVDAAFDLLDHGWSPR